MCNQAKEKKIKIVITSNTSWSIYNFRLNLARTLKKKGYKVVIIAPYDKYSEFLKKEFEFHEVYINPKGTNPIEDLKTIVDYYKLYKKIRPDVVLSFTIKPNIYGTIVCSFLGVKTINNITGLGTLFTKESIASKAAKILYKFSFKKADFVFFQNKDDFELFKKLRLVTHNKCDILPGSGVDIEKFKPIKIKKSNSVFKFILVSRMIKEKGVFEYIKAAKIIKQKYNNVEFLLLGPTDTLNPSAITKQDLEKYKKERVINYLGGTDDVRQEIAQSDCVVLPSYYREGVPRVLLEAASMEKPIITTNNIGCREVVEDGINGFLCKIRDPEDLAKKMEKMLNLTKDERIKMGKRGREKIEREFDEKFVIQKYLGKIEEIIDYTVSTSGALKDT